MHLPVLSQADNLEVIMRNFGDNMKPLIRRIFSLETLGMLVQLLLWVIAFYILFSVLASDFDFSEFRYVGY